MRISKRSNINWLMILRVTGWLLIIEGLFMLVPLFVAVAYGEEDYLSFLMSTGATMLAGMGLAFGLHGSRSDMGKREGFLLTTLIWIVLSLFGMLPFMLSSVEMSFNDAFFESMSGFTTTGVSVLSEVEHLSHGVHIWRCLMQWIGGMGIILFTLAVLPMLNSSGGMQMFNAEVTGITHDKLRPRVSQTAKRLWGIYILLTVLLAVLLWLGPMDMFDSVCHAFSSMSTGGFSTRNASVGAWDSLYVKIVITVFMFLGGVNFALIYKASNGDFKSSWRNETFRMYIRIILVMFVLFVIALVANGTGDSITSLTIDPLFQIVSTISSTGYTVDNFENYGTFIVTLVCVLMFFGACAGSTSGGAKIDRMIYLWKNSRNELYRCLHSNRIFSVSINGKIQPPELVSKVIAFLCIYVIVIVGGSISLTAMGLPLGDSFVSSFSCVSNTGFGFGSTGYAGCSYDVIPAVGKWVLAALMLIGRLELFTVLILFTPRFWTK